MRYLAENVRKQLNYIMPWCEVKKVTLYMGGTKPVILDLPKTNTAFAEFGAGCGIGKYAKKK